MSQNKHLVGIVIFVSILCVILLLSTVAMYFNFNSEIQNKDSEIANLNTVITNQNNQINQINSTGSEQQATIDRLQKVANLTGQILLPNPIDTYSGDWYGQWELVNTFSGNTNPSQTSTFQISSAYHLFRLNITLTGSTGGNVQFNVVQVVGSQDITAMIYSVTISSGPIEQDTVYLFAETTGTNSYYLSFSNYRNIASWTIGVEQLSA